MGPAVQPKYQESESSQKQKMKTKKNFGKGKKKKGGADLGLTVQPDNQESVLPEVLKKKTKKNFGKGKVKKSTNKTIQRKNAKPAFLKKLEDLSASDIDSDEDFGLNGPEFGPLSDTSSSDYENQEQEDFEEEESGRIPMDADGWNGVPSVGDEEKDSDDDDDDDDDDGDDDDDDDDDDDGEGSDGEGSSSGEEVPLPEGPVEGDSSEEEDTKKHPKFDPEREMRTVFIGNLPCNVKKMKVMKWFSKFGKVEAVRLRCAPIANPEMPKKVSAMQKDFHESRTNINAFVRFASIDSVDKAVQANGAQWDEDHHIRIDRAVAGKKHDDKKAVFLGNLPFDVEEEAIRQLFVDCGDIEDVRIIRDKKTNVGKGFAYVNFAGRHSVGLALAKDGDLVGKRPVRVQRCNYKESKYTTKAPSNPKDSRNRPKKPHKGHQLKRLQSKKKSVSGKEEKSSFEGEQAKKREKRMKRKKNLKKNKKEKFIEVLNSKAKKPKLAGGSN